ncbi:PEP/pyruvate-binding domain-containing protein [Streptomyces halobius]|uniref:PEP/pyruvate-binding domain-containing protein n=1 Tax=Streptomyces halobius TaxID=2879846 RepID=A0ABY4MIC8_9ACTN|nr:PEP/pyruvate-binding domain-containing protein [Streptomyces halobius]UQA97452.1 PEP/pyruvate-binding domain-containing protein [Streptomyces halobius]
MSATDKCPSVTVIIPAGLDVPLTVPAFGRLAGSLAGIPFVKLVVDLDDATLHFIDSTGNPLHVQYMAKHILDVPLDDLLSDIDTFNHEVYARPDRRFCLGVLALHRRPGVDGSEPESVFMSLETVEADTMTGDLLLTFYRHVRAHIHPSVPLFLKPANHVQEGSVADIPPGELPRVPAHELLSRRTYVPLNPGTAHGRLRVFRSACAYRASADTLRPHDIVVMPRVPDDIPRLSGLINAEHTTPLSHTNVLATGWNIPNAIQTDIIDRLDEAGLDGEWVSYEVTATAAGVRVEAAEQSAALDGLRLRAADRTVLKRRPDTDPAPIVALSRLRMGDHHRYGTKAANLGELSHVIENGSQHLLGFYRVPRPPRADLLGHLSRLLGVHGPGRGPADEAALAASAQRLIGRHLRVPRGIALPFWLQRRFLESSPAVVGSIDRLVKALELGTQHLDEICAELQHLIRTTPMPDDIRTRIDRAVATHLPGADRLVVRSSSNAEDLEGFSAAGVYESFRCAGTRDAIADGVREVWASLMSARSVRLRDQAGLPLEDCCMGVVVQEEVAVPLGGVLVTCSPFDGRDFRNVYANISASSVADVVNGVGAPLQHLYNTVEGGGRTVSLGSATADLDEGTKHALGRLALVGRLLQSHFSPDGLYGTPVDIEWALDGERIQMLQIRPYGARAGA